MNPADIWDLWPDAVFLCDPDGRVTDCNAAASSRYGYELTQARGRPLVALLRSRLPLPPAEVHEAVTDEGLWAGQVVQHDRDGRAHLVDSRWIAVRDGGGVQTAILVIDGESVPAPGPVASGEPTPPAAPPAQQRLRDAVHALNNALGAIIAHAAVLQDEWQSGPGADAAIVGDSLAAIDRSVEQAARLARSLTEPPSSGPSGPPPGDVAADPVLAVDDQNGQSAGGSASTILVVDDDEELRAVMDRVLSRAGYAVTSADSAGAALQISQRLAVDLLITDLTMTDMGGAELAAALRERQPRCRVLFVTGSRDRLLGDDLPGGAALLEKPFRSQALVQCVSELVGAPG